MKTAKELFEKLGGSVKVAAALDLNQYTVDRWPNSGVPQWHWQNILDFAKRENVKLTLEDLHQINLEIQRKKEGSK